MDGASETLPSARSSHFEKKACRTSPRSALRAGDLALSHYNRQKLREALERFRGERAAHGAQQVEPGDGADDAAVLDHGKAPE